VGPSTGGGGGLNPGPPGRSESLYRLSYVGRSLTTEPKKVMEKRNLLTYLLLALSFDNFFVLTKRLAPGN
jgi:hypothetical protein